MGRRQHTTCNEVGTSSNELIKPLIGEQHLAESLISIGATPWPLDGSNVARFGDRRAETSRSTELLDLADQVGKGVLTRKIEASWPNTGCAKDFAVDMELLDGGVELL
jgi:hypothetical protein